MLFSIAIEVVIVIAVKELAGLLTMHWDIGAIKIQHGLLWAFTIACRSAFCSIRDSVDLPDSAFSSPSAV